MLPTGTIGLEPIPTFLETAALPVKLCPINTHKPVEKKREELHLISFSLRTSDL